MSRLYRRDTGLMAMLRELDDFGIRALDLARAPGRFWGAEGTNVPLLTSSVDARRVTAVLTPAELLALPPEAGDSWLARSRRSVSAAFAWFLLAEDPQRRLDVRPVVTLAHQASLVRHVLDHANLRRVLIADEVGLGKTIEAALIIGELLEQQPTLRILYLAPARLVGNVMREFRRLELPFRAWVSGEEGDARLGGKNGDACVVASIHRAVHPSHVDKVSRTEWDVLIVDEAHHLSDWAEGGGSPVRKYKLVQEIVSHLGPEGRLFLLTGTPHQGHAARFENILRLLKRPGESDEAVRGRVIYRTKEDVRDWDERPLFPLRRVREPVAVDLGAEHRRWLENIHDFFEPERNERPGDARRRAATWRCGLALQWATSSVQAGLGFLVRQALRAGANLKLRGLQRALTLLRPYRDGQPDEPVVRLFERMQHDIVRQEQTSSLEDLEDLEPEHPAVVQLDKLSHLLEEGSALLERDPNKKWDILFEQVLHDLGEEKVVLFAQPIETVTALCGYIERRTGRRPAKIIGAQSEQMRTEQIDAFWRSDGPQFLVSSRAGGEGLNLQVARRLVHVDVPWNPMELEQRVGRVHRFKSRRTILVDTLVVKDSREVDTYRVAREKLHSIARTVVAPERFEELYSRVMALVPPEELQDVMGERPLGPLDPSETDRINKLVTEGFEQWRKFHDEYAGNQRKVRALDPGQARWSDLESLLTEELQARPLHDFEVLRFRTSEEEVVDASEVATVFEVAGRPRACGDYSGMPVTGARGATADAIGLNSPEVSAVLRHLAFPERPSGAAVLRWPAGRPQLTSTGVLGLVVLARQSLRQQQGTWVEHRLELEGSLIRTDGAQQLPPTELADLLRKLRGAVAVKEPVIDASLLGSVKGIESQRSLELRQPSDTDHRDGIRHVVWPVLAAVFVT
ncbi:DEAD/DEAH box helicase [Corallococcus terminator]|uniref:DEAD/DEAH box helicase n=1 Tax=Corallococcus terminator TaxID=2316733 RepID=A0A3A8HRE8_9BACT|nr:helicase-related protein [Corallococcus terminator]RKG73088.1 DEAD/DEAH box helicase [Corallococcus terminator]